MLSASDLIRTLFNNLKKFCSSRKKRSHTHNYIHFDAPETLREKRSMIDKGPMSFSNITV